MPTFWLGNFWHPTNEALNASSIYHWLGKDSSFFLVSWSHSLLVSLMICGWKLEVHTCEYHLLGDYCHHTANNLLVNSKNHLKSPVIFGVLCRKFYSLVGGRSAQANTNHRGRRRPRGVSRGAERITALWLMLPAAAGSPPRHGRLVPVPPCSTSGHPVMAAFALHKVGTTGLRRAASRPRERRRRS